MDYRELININAVEQRALELIRTDPNQAQFFVSRVKSLKWFYPLKQEGHFKPEKIPYSDDGHARFWNVLYYLVRVSEQASQKPQYAKELIEIIDNIVKFSATQKKIDSYYIWWYCVKITNNLPSGEIKKYLSLEQFRYWLQVWAGHSPDVDLIISDIIEKLLPKFLEDDYGPDYGYENIIIDVIRQTQISLGQPYNLNRKITMPISKYLTLVRVIKFGLEG